MIYQQSAPPQATIRLGQSDVDSAQAGCFVVSLCNILNLAGYDVSASDLLNGMNRINGYTPDGNAYWGAFHTLYPQLTITGVGGVGDYELVQGHNGNHYHYWVECAKGTFDPWTGTSYHPAGYTATGYRMRVNCVSNPSRIVIVPVSFVPGLPDTEFTMVTTASLNFRSAPYTSSPVMVSYPEGTTIECKGIATGEPINGNPRWCVSKVHGWYCTSEYARVTSTNNPL